MCGIHCVEIVPVEFYHYITDGTVLLLYITDGKE